MRPDAITLLRDLRPPDPAIAPDEAALERIVGSPAPPPPTRRRLLRPALALASITAAVATAFAVVPGGSPDVLAQTEAALTDENSILHFRTEVRFRSHGAELGTREPDAQVDGRSEAWQADAGRKERQIHDGAGEFVRDWDARRSVAYNAQRDELIHHTDPDVFGPNARPRGIDSPTLFGGSVIGDLSRTLERARRGEENVKLVGETSVRGIEVYELSIEYSEDGGAFFQPGPNGEDRPVKAWRTIYVDKERFLPVRVVERTEWLARGGEIVQSITDYVEIERLPRTPENEKLLEMSPHPGAKVIREGRV